MHDAGASKSEIATELGRDRSTIGRELNRNAAAGEYSAVAAQGLAQQRRQQRPLVRKSDRPDVRLDAQPPGSLVITRPDRRTIEV